MTNLLGHVETGNRSHDVDRICLCLFETMLVTLLALLDDLLHGVKKSPCQEIFVQVFGPVLVVREFSDEEAAVAEANSTPYGTAPPPCLQAIVPGSLSRFWIRLLLNLCLEGCS